MQSPSINSTRLPSSTPDHNRAKITGLSYLVILVFLLAGLSLLLAPISAIRWSRLPFPGFLVEHTLVVPDIGDARWDGRAAGLSYPHRVTQVGEHAVSNSQSYQSAIASLTMGQEIEIQTVQPDGTLFVFPSLRVTGFSTSALLRLFWLPYGIGLAYYVMGLLVFRIRSSIRPGRAFAFFCAFSALSISLTFDLSTTHLSYNLWPFIITLQASTLASLALFFPEEGNTIKRYPRLRFVPYVVSLLLASWALTYQSNPADPWAYIRAWQVNYVYAAACIFFFLGVVFYRQARSKSPVIRQQARLILWGSAFAFLPLGIWLAAPLFNLPLEWNPALLLPSLLIFPLSIGIAITRYRLWDLDTILNRTLVYGLLTALLGLVYYLAVFTLENLFIGRTAPKNPFIIAGITLVLAALFSPVRRIVQTFIDRRFFRQKYDIARTISAFGETIRNEVNLERLNAEMVSIVQNTIQPSHVNLCNCIGTKVLTPFSLDPEDPFQTYLLQANDSVLIRELELDSPGLRDLRQQEVELVVPLISQGELVGLLNLGSRLSEQEYSIHDMLLLNMLASQAAPALRVAQLVHQYQMQSLQRQRMEAELSVAHLIQNTLIPQNLPELPGWQFSGFYQPARAVGGDYYDFIQLPDQRLGIVIGDAADKGVPAALVMATARSLLRSVAPEEAQPARVLERVNILLYDHIPTNMFVTCLYMVISMDSGQITLANAGHNLPYLAREGSIKKLHATGLPLGIFPDQSYEEVQANLLPGDNLFLYSDGLVEVHNSQGHMLGFDGLAQIIASLPEESNLVSNIIAAYQHFVGAQGEQEDDIALVAIQRSPLP